MELSISDLFYLSYPRLTSFSDVEAPNDPWVQQVSDDLIRALTKLAPRSRIRSTEQTLAEDLGATERRARALARAQVFVPLVSHDYFNYSSSMSEWTAFRQRLEMHPRFEAIGHVTPILWAPVDSGSLVAFGEVLQFGKDIPAYSAIGLSKMLRITGHRREYEQLVERFAQRIMTTARYRPLPPGEERRLVAAHPAARNRVPFVVAVIAPSLSQSSDHLLPSRYGDRAEDWRAFGPRYLPVAEYAANVAERYAMPVWVADFASFGRLLATKPGLVLVDPYSVRHPDCMAMLASARADLRGVQVIVVEDDEPDRSIQIAQCVREVVRLLGDELTGYTTVVSGHELLTRKLDTAIPEARRRFLRTKAPRLEPGGEFPERPRLRLPPPELPQGGVQ